MSTLSSQLAPPENKHAQELERLRAEIGLMPEAAQSLLLACFIGHLKPLCEQRTLKPGDLASTLSKAMTFVGNYHALDTAARNATTNHTTHHVAHS